MRYPYLTRLPTFYDPWIYLLLPAIGFALSSSYRSESRPAHRDVWFLVWWAALVLGFFSFTGNHPWYLLPMYVPTALLLGRLLDETMRGTVEAVLSTVGGALAALAFSYRVPLQSPIAVERAQGLQGFLPSGEPFLAAIVVGTVALVVGPALGRRYVSDREWERPLRVGAVIAVVVFSSTIASPVVFPGNSWDRQQHELADVVRGETPPDSSVYLQPATTDQEVYHAFAFHAERPLEPATVREMNDDERIRYALVVAESRSRLTRPHEVIAAGQTSRGTEILLVEFG